MKRWLLAVLTCLALPVALGSPASPAWQIAFPGQIAWQQVTELGDLIVATDAGLHGVDAGTGAIRWSHPEFAAGSSQRLEPIDGSPFYRLVNGSAMYILDPIDGRVLFDSAEAGVAEVDEVYFLYQTDNLLVKGKSDLLAKAVAVLVDMITGKAVWSVELDLGKVLSVDATDGDQILIVTLFDIFSLERASGKVTWREPTMPEIQMSKSEKLNQLMMRFAEEVFKEDDVSVDFVRRPGSNDLYLGVGSLSQATARYVAMDARTGSRRWTQELANNYPGFQMLRDDGILVMPYYYARDTHVFGGNRVNLLDYASGEGKWGKKARGLDIKGGVTQVFEIAGGILLAAYSGNESFLYVLDPKRGEFLLKKPVEVEGQVRAIYETASGILCFAGEEINLIDARSGDFKWKKPIVSSPRLTTMSENRIYAYDTKSSSIKVVDTRTGNVDEITGKKIRFEGKESPTGIEVRAEGVLLTSSQNMALFDRSGNLLYQQHYPAPRRPGWMRALYYAQGIRAAIVSAQSYYVTGAMIGASLTPEYKEADIGTRSIVTGIAGVYGEQAQYAQSVAAESFRRANERFKATQRTQDAQIILSQVDKRVHLLKVGKGSGAIDATLDLGDEQEPDYAVDPITDQIYLQTDGNTIVSYRL